jgi:putative spermidine/putrescine transport system ATP-binding protein
VTHDQEEALSLADRVALLNKGKLEQFAPPTEIYDRPASLFVNTFVGSANVLPGIVTGLDGALQTIALDIGGSLAARMPVPVPAGQRVQVCLRPEALSITPHPEGLPAMVEVGLPLGAHIVYELRLKDGTLLKSVASRKAGDEALPPGTEVRLRQQSPGTAFPL